MEIRFYASEGDNPGMEMDDPFLVKADNADSVSFLDEEQSAEFQALALQAREALTRTQLDPLKLACLLEEHGTPVYRLKYGYLPRFILALLQVSPGFIPNPKGLRGFLLSLSLAVIAVRPSQSSTQAAEKPKGLFIVTPSLFSTGFMAYQLHHWLAFQSGLPGYCEKAQLLYKRFCKDNKGKLTSDSIQDWNEEDLTALQAAIRQELSALKFFKSLVKDVLFLAQPGNRTIKQSK